MACLGVSNFHPHHVNDAVRELQDQWRLTKALEELKQLDQQHDANRRETDANHSEAATRRKEAFLKEESAFKIFNGFKDEQSMTPEKLAALRRQKQQRQQEARQRAQAKKRRWEETFGTSSAQSSSSSTHSPASCDIRLSFVFERLVERLNKFVQTHSVYACATTLRAKIVSFSVHLPPSTSTPTSAASSALTIWVQPPIELFEEPYCCSHTKGRVNLVEFMTVVSTTNAIRRRRIYDEVQCRIEWRQTKRTDVRNGTDVRDGGGLLPLSTLIPTAILFATSAALVVQYTKYLDWLMEDPLVLTMFLSSEFRSLFTIPTAPTPSPPTASSGSSTGMEIEVDETEEVKIAPPIPDPPRTDMVEVVDEKINREEEKEEDVTKEEQVPIKEPKRKRQKREVLASARQLRPRRICTCHM